MKTRLPTYSMHSSTRCRPIPYILGLRVRPKAAKTFMRPWLRLGMQPEAMELESFSMTLNSVPAGVWRSADEMFGRAATSTPEFSDAITAIFENSWRLGVAVYLHAVWRWRVGHFDELNDISETYRAAALLTKLRQGYNTVIQHMKNVASPRTVAAVSVLIRRVLAQDGSVVPRPRNRIATTEYLLFYDGRSHGSPGAGGSGAIVLKIGLKELKV
ncbi:unnamed protein product [Phytophthora fragariaefolia]|uniref:Unnamed protein product n=1 Tax=Phytophthora fragariaefolia TaxID=1490495 RepID=A0A9W6Y504_9STRA|nr:unnamed protein product [Phytophthora fragariaefolia]